MHDAWLLSGHCAHSFDCERWKSGCGQCPDLSIYPAIRRDSTAYNWRRKKGLYAQSRLYVAAPSQWLLQTVGQSMLAPAVIESRVIPNGVDTDVFHPDDKAAARTELGISPGARVLVFAAAGIRRNAFKDYRTMRAAVALVAERLHESNVLFVGLGEDAPAEQVGAARVVFVEYQKDREALARYYQAADVYIHAARAESWGLTITEALACGIPVAATATGGIPEQVKGLRWDGMTSGSAMCDPSEATGVLASPGDSPGLAAGIELLLTDDDLRRRLGSNAARDAHQRFSLDRQASDYLAWYKEILAEKETEKECPVRA
jgi:glycosyltransferase involved in cell wall biosynthesis